VVSFDFHDTDSTSYIFAAMTGTQIVGESLTILPLAGQM
jgi:hypothetical protein